MASVDPVRAEQAATPRPGSRPVRSPLLVPAVVLMGVLATLAVVAPTVWGDAATAIDPAQARQGPSWEHWLGTDVLGRDVLARTLTATRPSLLLAVCATALGLLVGVPLGALPAVLGKRAGRLVSGAVNLGVAFPGLLLALFIAAIVGVGGTAAVVALGLAAAPGFARLTETLTASVAGRDFVAAATTLGVGRFRRLTRHILPNIAEPLILNGTMAVGGMLMAFSGLSFLGLGVQAPAYDWGLLLNEGLARVHSQPAAALAPGIALLVAGVTFNLVGESLAALSTRSRAAAPARFTGAAGPHAGDPAPTGTDSGITDHDACVLCADGIRVGFADTEPVRGVSLHVRRGEIVALVGESGSGKTLTAAAITGLVPPPGRVDIARNELAGTDIRDRSGRATRRLLGTSLGVVFQDPMTALNPALRVGTQLTEVATVHLDMDRGSARRRAVERLGQVRLAHPERLLRKHPHQLSGGMRQRAVIAMGLMGRPRLLVADEPTTALDVTVQQDILRLLRDLASTADVGVVLITHDIAVVSQVADRVLVMYAGLVVEDLPVAALVGGRAVHPYTRALIAAVPDMSTDRTRSLTTITGRPPRPADVGAGCAFAPRCPRAGQRCTTQLPPLLAVGDTRAACWHPIAAGDGSESEPSGVGP